MGIRWGIDLGGTKLEGVVIDDEQLSSPLCRMRIPTFLSPGESKCYEEIVERIAYLVDLMRKETGLSPERLGFATPGAIDPSSGTLRNSNTTILNGRPLAADLRERLGVPIAMENDANCFALAEACFGAARGAGVVFGVIMGTGVGGGIVVDNKLLRGLQGISGEWGHNVLIPDGPSCYCGKRGCVETILSGPALEAWYQSRSGTFRVLSEIVRDARAQSNELGVELLRHLTEWFGRALSVVINILDPDVVVLGGGVSNISELYDGGVQELRKHIFNPRPQTRIVKNQLGDSGGVFGAAML